MQVGLTGGQGYLPRGPKDPFWTHSAPCPSPRVHSGFFVALSWEVCLQLPVPTCCRISQTPHRASL